VTNRTLPASRALSFYPVSLLGMNIFALSAAFSLALTAFVAEEANALAPFALAPSGKSGGAASLEFDRRTIADQLIYVRKMTGGFGYSPSENFSIWGDGGVASLQMFIGSRSPSGAYGPAFGAGWAWERKQPLFKGWKPLLSGRASYLQSKLSDDYTQGGSARSRRSRIEWSEVRTLAGLSKDIRGASAAWGLASRYLSQDEYRSLRSGSSVQKNHFVYTSGLRPGLFTYWGKPLKAKFFIQALAEVYPEGGRISVAVGQWGAP